MTQATIPKSGVDVGSASRTSGGGVGLAWRALIERREAAILLVAIALFVYFSVASANFLSEANLQNLSYFVGPVAVIGAGEVMLLVCAEVDLSAGTVFVFAPFIVYYLNSSFGLPMLLAIVLAVAISAAIGFVNGVITTGLNVPSFITTLGSLFALDGVMLVITNAAQLTPTTDGTVTSIFGISGWSEIIWAGVLAAIMYVLLDRTRFGMHTIASGGNLLGAAEAGVPVNRVKIWCFILCSALSALIGIVDANRVGVLDPGNPGTQEMFYAIAAAVIGGTALTGGSGTIIGACIGAIVLGILDVGLTIVGVNANAFVLILGVAILGAMIANVQLAKASDRRRLLR